MKEATQAFIIVIGIFTGLVWIMFLAGIIWWWWEERDRHETDNKDSNHS